jgi:hypothetical protein
MLDLEIIECYVFCLLQLDKKVDAFMQNDYSCHSLLLNKMHTPCESGDYIPIFGQVLWSTFCTHGAADKLIAGEAQPEPIFGYFLAEDRGPERK